MLRKNLHVVEKDKVYRTGKLKPEDFARVVDELGIKSLLRVICLNRRNRQYFRELGEICDQRGIKAFNVSLQHNHVPPKDRLRKILDVFDTAEYPLLIMCWRGADRSGLTSALYKMSRNYPRKEVEGELKLFPYGHLWLLHPRFHTFLKRLYDEFSGNLKNYLLSRVDFSSPDYH